MRRGRERGRERERGRPLPAAVWALCRALPPRARPAPDTLRRARFDRPQASAPCWALLHALLRRGQRAPDALDAQVRFVKSALWYYGYGRSELYGLPCDGSAGGRELLLAFSWLLHRLRLPERLLAHDRVRTGDEASVCTGSDSPEPEPCLPTGRTSQTEETKEPLLPKLLSPPLSSSCEDDLPCSQEDRTEVAPECSLEDQVDVRYLQWLSGRLRFQWQSLHALHQEQCKLLHKIHLFTSGCHMDKILGHFSVTETDLVRRPENYKQLLELLESETMQLEAFLEWKQLEQVYWQWMEAVLDDMSEEGSLCKARDAHPQKSPLPKAGACCHWAGSLVGKIDRLSTDLTNVYDQLQELVAHRKSAWHEKVKTREEELQKENFCSAAAKTQEAVELKLLDITHRCAPTEKRMHGSCRLVFRSRDSTDKTGFGRSVSKEPVPAISAAEVIRELQVRKGSLERELRQLQEESRQRMDEIARGLDGVICVSP